MYCDTLDFNLINFLRVVIFSPPRVARAPSISHLMKRKNI